MLVLTRVDNRLIHGQVIQTWVPQLSVRRILVVDDAASASPLTRAAMSLAVPPGIGVTIVSFAEADFRALAAAPEQTLLLVREVADALRARERGATTRALNIGNVHFAPGRVPITPSVFLRPDELASLAALAQSGVEVEFRAVPKEKAVTLAEAQAKLAATAASSPKSP